MANKKKHAALNGISSCTKKVKNCRQRKLNVIRWVEPLPDPGSDWGSAAGEGINAWLGAPRRNRKHGGKGGRAAGEKNRIGVEIPE